MYNAINFGYINTATSEWAYSGAIIGPNPIDYTVNKASIATLLCPSDGVVNTCSGYAAVHQLPTRQLQLRGEHRASAERAAAGRLAEHEGQPSRR